MQLTSANVQKVPEVVRSNQQLTREEEREEEGKEEEEATDEGQVRIVG